MHRAIRLLAAGLLTLACVVASSIGHALPAQASSILAVTTVTCPLGTQYSTYSPGLTYTSRPTAFTARGSLAPCVSPSHPQLVGATFTASGSGSASCVGASFRERSVYTWNTGQKSVVEGTLTINAKPNGQTVLVRVGEITDGLFEGATAVQTKVLPALDLAGCLSPEGITGDSGALSLTIVKWNPSGAYGSGYPGELPSGERLL